MESKKGKRRARIVGNLLDVIDDYFKGTERHREDQDFLALCERISGKEVNLFFIGGDAFEEVDKSYWLPNCCFTILEEEQ